jgi:hypothetical protein
MHKVAQGIIQGNIQEQTRLLRAENNLRCKAVILVIWLRERVTDLVMPSATLSELRIIEENQ